MGSAKSLAGMAACAVFLLGDPASARAQDERVYEYYENYDVGYDTNYDDDWFFDYYAYNPAAAEPEYDYYTDYDYDTDRFDWQEDGVIGVEP